MIKILLNSGADPNIADIHGITSLQYASCAHCSADTLQALTDCGAYVNTTVDNRQIASRVAYFKEFTTAMKHAVQNGINVRRTHADLNLPDCGGITPLHIAVMGGCSNDFLLQLVYSGADVNATNMYNETALLHACNKGNTDAIYILLNAGADPNIANYGGNTGLHMAADGECSKEAMQAIIAHGANVNAVDQRNSTALMRTSNDGHEDTTNVLLNAGADPNIADANGKTSLHHAIVGRCNERIVQAIVDKGADVNARDIKSRTALLSASHFGYEHAIRILLKAGADPNIADENGETCLHHAVLGECSKEVLRKMLDQGANVNATCNMSHTALMLALHQRNSDAINVFLNAGINPFIADGNGNTCLHHAVLVHSNKKTLQAIVDNGADVNALNKENESPLILASIMRNVGAIYVRLEAGADPNIADADGNSCLHHAIMGGRCRGNALLHAIVNSGIDVNARNIKKQSALLMASRIRDVDSQSYPECTSECWS